MEVRETGSCCLETKAQSETEAAGWSLEPCSPNRLPRDSTNTRIEKMSTLTQSPVITRPTSPLDTAKELDTRILVEVECSLCKAHFHCGSSWNPCLSNIPLSSRKSTGSVCASLTACPSSYPASPCHHRVSPRPPVPPPCLSIFTDGVFSQKACRISRWTHDSGTASQSQKAVLSDSFLDTRR